MTIRELMALAAENDFYREKIDPETALNRRIATIVARAKMATDPTLSFYDNNKEELHVQCGVTETSS